MEGAEGRQGRPRLRRPVRRAGAAAVGQVGGACDLLVLDAPHLYDRTGNPYVGPDGQDWPDNAERFAALARCGADVGLGLTRLPVPDIVHAHDWQAALAPAYLHYADAPRPATVMTVHNLAFQGQFPAAMLAPLGLPPAAFAFDGIEYYGGIGFLKAGLQLSDRITTVSPTYALEILGAEAGMGLDGLLRARAGVLHGHHQRHRHAGVESGLRSRHPRRLRPEAPEGPQGRQARAPAATGPARGP